MSRHPLPAQRQRLIMEALQRDGSVTVAEVSRVLGVTETTVRRDINQLAEQGVLVRVHGGATALADRAPARAGSRPTTATLVVPTDDFHWGAIVSAVRAAARAAELALHVHRDDAVTPDLLRRLAADPPAGWLLAPPLMAPSRDTFDDWLDHCPVPVVLLERESTPGVGTGVQSVTSDHARNAAAVVGHLADLGHRRIGMMVPTGGPRADEYVRGWQQALARRGLPVTPVLPSIDIIDPGRAELTHRVVEALRTDRHTALLVLGDPHAMVLLQICQEVGIAVPDDLSVVSFGDYMASWGHPALTALRPPYETLGATAVRLLLARLRGGSTPPSQHIQLEGTLVPRETVAPPP
ncbi:substrate-binding domain-containing protein [Propionibacteriaceae bacterium Y2011]